MDEETKTINRVIHDRKNPYTMINSRLAADVTISYKAKGLMLYMLSRKQGWKFNITDLVNRSTDGETSVRSGLRELQDAGYIRRFPVRDAKGKIERWEFWVYEVPEQALEDEQNVERGIDDEQIPEEESNTSATDSGQERGFLNLSIDELMNG